MAGWLVCHPRGDLEDNVTTKSFASEPQRVELANKLVTLASLLFEDLHSYHGITADAIRAFKDVFLYADLIAHF